MEIRHAVIAAAGFGSRLHQGIPKCLVEIDGHKIIEYQLALLRDVPDVRVVVGYHGDEVVRAVKALRPDVTCISNPRYDTTTTLQSYYMGCHDIHDFFILMDGDIIPHKTSFRQFLSQFSGDNMIGVSPPPRRTPSLSTRTRGTGSLRSPGRSRPPLNGPISPCCTRTFSRMSPRTSISAWKKPPDTGRGCGTSGDRYGLRYAVRAECHEGDPGVFSVSGNRERGAL